MELSLQPPISVSNNQQINQYLFNSHYMFSTILGAWLLEIN